jgi:hypothetical protein
LCQNGGLSIRETEKSQGPSQASRVFLGDDSHIAFGKKNSVMKKEV